MLQQSQLGRRNNTYGRCSKSTRWQTANQNSPKAYDHKVIDQAAKQIVDTALRTGASLAGPIPLPTRRSTYTVIKSPHVYKKGREQFEMRVHKRLIDVFEPTPKTIDSLMNLSLPAGCDVEIKM